MAKPLKREGWKFNIGAGHHFDHDQKWKEFRVGEMPYNNTYHNTNIEDCPVLKDDRIPR